MSYQVLARKWRPRIFREMVGQEHVLKALINALDHDRLHHAYLFTGTRGVGKTTIARILAKCLNCEVGVSSEPCDKCDSCVEINEGRFVDLIEVDAASRTKVEDTRELLDNVQYKPSKGRFKVYLIDEVHMLSGHSFNALLKTLEEPPPHVKFLLATTDPQKLPVTILSRCLQFHLKNMSPERIVDHLSHVLEREMIPFETSALWLLGRAADGSMRDALSLTDQAIAFGSGKVTEDDVSQMLGTIDQRHVYDLLQALGQMDGKALLDRVAAMAEQSPDYSEALAALINLLHRIAIAQTLPEAVDNTFGDREELLDLAQRFTPEDIQLFYQTAILGRRDLPLAPDPRGGFEMVLLRMLAFKPQGVIEAPQKPLSAHPAKRIDEGNVSVKKSEAGTATRASGPATVAEPQNDKSAVIEPTPEKTADKNVDAKVDEKGSSIKRETFSPTKNVVEKTSGSAELTENREAKQPAVANQQAPSNIANDGTKQVRSEVNTAAPGEQPSPEDWRSIAPNLPAGGVLKNTLLHCQLISRSSGDYQFILDEKNSTLYDESHQQRIAQLLSEHYGEAINVVIQVGQTSTETPAKYLLRKQAERQAQAVNAMQADPIVNEIINTFGATLQIDSIEPVDQPSEKM